MSHDASESNSRFFLPGLLTLGLVLLLIVAAMLFRSGTKTARVFSPAQQVVVLLVPGASLADWQNRESMPNLAAFARGDTTTSVSQGFVGVFPNRLPWRTGSARLATLSPAVSEDLVRASRVLGGEPLGAALRNAGVLQVALGNDPAARAFTGNTVASAVSPDLAYENADMEPEWRTNQPDAVGGFVTDPERLAAAIHRTAAKSAAASLLLTVTFDDLLRCDTYAPLTRPAAAAAQRRAALRRLDTLFAQLTGSGPNALPPSTALLMLTPVGSMEAAERGELLGPVLLRPPSDRPAIPGLLLTSPSTRQTPGLLAPGDIAAAVRHLMGADEKSGGGRAAVVLETGAASTDDAEYLAVRVANWSAQARENRLLVTLPWLLAGTLLLSLLFRQEKARDAILVGASATPLALLVAAPFASREPGKEALIYGIAGLITLAVAAVSAILTGRRAAEGDAAILVLRAVFLATAAVILLDTLSGGALLARSPLSYSPVAAARFYGIGNELSGVFLGASVLAVGVLCPSPLGAALGGIIAALISGMPMFGADAGGFLSALVGFGGLFVLLTAARAENKRRAYVRSGISVGVIVLLLFAAYVVGNGRQPVGSRTHVGEAVASAQTQGGTKALLPLINRKAATGVRLLFTSPWSILLITEAGLCFWAWRRRSPGDAAFRAVCQAAFISAITLLLVNDSGVAAAATCLLYPTSSLLLTKASSGPPPGAD